VVSVVTDMMSRINENKYGALGSIIGVGEGYRLIEVPVTRVSFLNLVKRG